jgi:hypothetical protein
MGDLITRLTSLFNLTKTVAVTLPGLVCSIAVVILLWPPMPVTLIPQVPVHTRGKSCPPITLTGTLLEAKSIDDLKKTARTNQDTLETSLRDLQECSEYETSQVGREETLNVNLKADITVLEKEQASLQDAYIAYQKANSPLTPTYSAKLTDVTGRIARKRSEILLHEQTIRDKNRNIQEIARYMKMVTDRLADPGRLRPQKSFDEFLTALADHTVALILLAIVIGYVLDPLNRAIYGALYDGFFRKLWNFLRGSRRPVSNPVKGM